MFVGLVKDPGRDWRPPDDGPEPGPDRGREVPWRTVTRVAAWVTILGILLALVPVVDHVVGHFVAFGLIVFTVTLGAWRAGRWFDQQYWEGLHEYNP